MPAHNLVNGDAQQVGYVRHILAIVNHRNFNDSGMPFHVGGNVQRANRGGQFDTRRKQRIEGDVDGARSGNELFHAGENGGRARLCGPLGRFRSLFHGMFHGALQRGEHPQVSSKSASSTSMPSAPQVRNRMSPPP